MMAHRDKLWSSTPFLSSRDKKVRWHVETNHGHPHPLPSRDKRARWHAETNYGHPYPFRHPKTSKSDGRRRQIMVIRTCSIQRQASLMARRDKSWSSAPLPSRDKRVRCYAETNHGHPHLCHPKTIKSDGTKRQIMVIHTLFAIQRQASPMAREDKSWSSAPFPSRDK